MPKLRFFSILVLLIIATSAKAAELINSDLHRFRIETVADGLDHPWALAQLPDGRFLVTERRGTLLLFDRPGALPQKIDGVPAVVARGQGGLLDLRLHPQYRDNGWIYLSLAKPIGDGALTTVVRAKLEGTRLTQLETIFEPPADQATKKSIHFGSRLAFDGRGYLFFSIGDRGGPTTPENLAQDLASVTGKIHRLKDDGKVPKDNPFVDQPGVEASIWAYGTRNAQGLVYDSASGRLWETEHGPRGGDELNLIRRGANLGWPIVTYGINYTGKPITEERRRPGMDDPVVVWTPVIAASGLELYRGDKFPRWRGNLFAGGLVSQKLVRMELNGTEVTKQEVLLEGSGRIRDVRTFADGLLYLVYDDPGRIVRLVPAD